MADWADEFEGPAGSAPDPSVWVPELGAGGWGDAQLQTYTEPPANAALTGSGMLTVTARTGADGAITSARFTTRGRVAFRYGTIAARLKVPPGSGVWPAFWMLGNDIDEVGWPACGEIDVMEYVGADPSAVRGTAHGPGYAGLGGGIGQGHEAGSPLSDDFHVFSVDWGPGQLVWRLDEDEYFRLTAADVTGPWPFEHPFFLVLNLAVGGTWPGNELDPAALPAELLVDWVRVTDAEVHLAA